MIFIVIITIIGHSRLCTLTPLGTVLAYFHAELRSRLYCWRLHSVKSNQIIYCKNNKINTKAKNGT